MGVVKSRTIIIMLALVSVSLPSHAATYVLDLGTTDLGTIHIGDLGSSPTVIQLTYQQTLSEQNLFGNTNFTGDYTFDIVTTSPVNFAIDAIINLSSLGGTLFKLDGMKLDGTPNFVQLISNTSALGGWYGSLSSGGDYMFTLAGQTSSLTGGGYDISVSAVPIPTAVILFGTGLICLAGVARRRKSVSPK